MGVLHIIGAPLLLVVRQALKESATGNPQVIDSVKAMEVDLLVMALQMGATAFFLFAMYIIVYQPIPVNAFYLRAFSSDGSTVKLRRELSRSMGRKFRLSGIRSPKRRTSPFVRFAAAGWMALRYAGSQHMDLEAGNNWLGRLMTSFSRANVAFLDIRKLTPQVHNEMILAWKQLGAERCIFIVDDKIPTVDSRRQIANLVGITDRLGTLKLVSCDNNSMEPSINELKPLLKSLPNSVAGFTPDAVAFAKTIVPPETWHLGWTKTQIVQAVSGAFVAFMVAIFAGSLELLSVVVGLVGVGLLLLFLRATWLAVTNGAVKRAARAVKLALFGVACFVGSNLVIVEKVRGPVNVTAVKNTANNLARAAKQYEFEYSKLPFKKWGISEAVESRGFTISVLVGEYSDWNPRGVEFYSLDSHNGPTKNDYGEWEVRDAWGNFFHFQFDGDYDGLIEILRGNNTDVTDVRASVIVYSAGPDGDFSTWEDNICSWE